MKPTIVVNAPTFYLYKILGVCNSASAAEIREVYKKHISKHHPDNYAGASDVIKLIQHAYEVLYNSETRRIYDLFCTQILYRGSNGTYTESSRMFAYPKPDWVVQKNDIVYVMDVSLRNIYKGKSTEIATKHLRIEIDLEQGTKDGQRLVYKGKGLKMAGHQPGDLVIIVNRVDYPFYTQNNVNLFCKLDIDEKVAQGGGNICIQHPLGNVVDFQLHPNEVTETGITKTLKGKGLKPSDNGAPGDLFIELCILFPEAEAVGLA